ncbi:response regulator [Allomuricauda sp. SCSIO 65647]|uniref:response regulator n=1 Tax=Allomuricauda sp. SCSIO 65647 TaxID=2908843 RepID=UPI001F316F9B|nr:response regulator [Muricauda sp. SCSIO 65647]UJH66082.1 response regulator [Muricauda sp. SCSIO 65647]
MKRIKRACVIDDDPIYTYWAKKIMGELKFSESILVFENGYDAIKGLKEITEKGEKLPEVILLDLNMPIMDGWDFLEDFIKLPHHNEDKVYVYIVSSSIAQRDLERAKDFDIVHNYILKPLTIKKLDGILKSVV